jgi:signal peptidase II
VGVLVIAFDQLTKQWALGALATRDIDVVWTLQFHLTFNKGTAFSLGGDRGPLIALVALAVVAFVLASGRQDGTRLGGLARGLVVGGAFGNLADRLFRADSGFLTGQVVDFIDLQWWPVFNIADAAVVVGCILLVFTVLFAAPDDEAEDEIVSDGTSGTEPNQPGGRERQRAQSPN